MTERCGSGYCDNCMQACNPEGRTDDDEDGAPCNGGAVKVCPRCASTSVETTTVGYYGLDMNRATCRGPGCGWVGRAHEMATTESGAEAAREAVTDCGDGSCILRDRTKPGGMRTNGGCQHYKRSGPELNAQLRAMGAEIVRLRGMLGG